MVPLSRGDESKKGHICPPSTAIHPADRWETAFIYSFICKFTQIRQETEGLDTISDLEEALLFNGPHHILEQTLARFMLNLRPQTRNIGSDVISSTVSLYFVEMFNKGELSIFWDEAHGQNIHPFERADFFWLDWATKLLVLRQLVEWQLCHSLEIKSLLDRAWGVVHMKHKKTNLEIVQETLQLPDDDPHSKKNLMMVPLGQDATKTRYWAVDASPRLYVSTNPWKVTATFTKLSSTKEEYEKVIEDLKENSPSPTKHGTKRPKSDAAHLALINLLESRIDIVDQDLQRIAKAKKNLLQKQVAASKMAEMSLRGPRTRRASKKPDYVYYHSEDKDFIDDTYQDPMDDEGDFINDDAMSEEDEYSNGLIQSQSRSPQAATLTRAVRRRSTRIGVSSSRNVGPHLQWRGERRSARLGSHVDYSLNYQRPNKYVRTNGSATPSLHEEIMDLEVSPDASKATALRPNEIAVTEIAGKKKSKYWFYAVEPIPATAIGESASSTSDIPSFREYMATEATPPSPATNSDTKMQNIAVVTANVECSRQHGQDRIIDSPFSFS